jgi:hypothetical protein
LFTDQNKRLHANRGKHPVTLGISVPGDEYVTAVLGLGKAAFDADGDGYDLRFNLSIARVIRDVRAAFLGGEYRKAVGILYDAIYAGDTISCGVIYRLLCQKSGWNNTGEDNSLHLWCALFITFRRLGYDFKYIKALINGDDLAYGQPEDWPVTIDAVALDLARNGIIISYAHTLPRFAMDITFLSHNLYERFCAPFGDLIVAGGNRHKLLSSINWVKSNETLSFEESCLAHLLGIRLCLWPWYADFVDVDELIDDFLSKIPHKTEMMCQLLKARLTEERIAYVHLKLESGSVFSPNSLVRVVENEVDQVTLSLINLTLKTIHD